MVLFFAFPSLVNAGELTDRIKRATDRLIAIVTDPELQSLEMEHKRNIMIRKAVDEIFDWEAFSQRAMARHWRKLSKSEKEEFVYLFGQLLERTYMDKTRQYSGEKMIFLNETIEKKYGIVEAKVITKDGTEIPVNYSAFKKQGEWFIYDVYVAGISLVNNYRVQFNDIITRSSYEELKARLKSKLEEK
jgi:phospholipid transport system substrate-binding protein